MLRKLLFTLALTAGLCGCVTNSYLRTSKTLERGEWELGGGVAANETYGGLVVAVAYGAADSVDLSLRAESNLLTFSPRLQLLSEKSAGLNLLLLGEATGRLFGTSCWQAGGGLVLGKTIGQFEPYLSNVIKFGTFPINYKLVERGAGRDTTTVNYSKLGTRYSIPDTKVFLQLEGGPVVWFLSSKASDAFVIWEGATAVGVKW